eukprot:2968-Heterococcus_DN1.PRE.1
MPGKQVTITDKQAVVTYDSINNDNMDDYSGAYSRAAVADNPRRNSSDHKSDSMLITMESGIITDSAHDVTRTTDDLEHGTTGANIIDNDSSNGICDAEKATSNTTAAVDDNAATSLTQHEAPVFNAIDVYVTTDDVTNDTLIATDAADDVTAHMNSTTTSGTSDIATGNSNALMIQPTSTEATDIDSTESAIVAKKPS